MNRVTTKTPYKELSGKGTVAQQAEEAWTYALSRYSSVVDETFAGKRHQRALADSFACASAGVCGSRFATLG